MRLIIAGPRDYTPKHEAIISVRLGIKKWFYKYNRVITQIVSGHSGVSDLAGETIAKEMGVDLKTFPYPNDKDLIERGLDPKLIPIKARGPLRNGWMADYAKETPPGGLLVIRDFGKHGARYTRGTDSMKVQALSRGLLVEDFCLGELPPEEMPIGFTACWKEFPNGNCRMPVDHDGDCSPY
jgi:hypothetical protein